VKESKLTIHEEPTFWPPNHDLLPSAYSPREDSRMLRANSVNVERLHKPLPHPNDAVYSEAYNSHIHLQGRRGTAPSQNHSRTRNVNAPVRADIEKWLHYTNPSDTKSLLDENLCIHWDDEPEMPKSATPCLGSEACGNYCTQIEGNTAPTNATTALSSSPIIVDPVSYHIQAQKFPCHHAKEHIVPCFTGYQIKHGTVKTTRQSQEDVDPHTPVRTPELSYTQIENDDTFASTWKTNRFSDPFSSPSKSAKLGQVTNDADGKHSDSDTLHVSPLTVPATDFLKLRKDSAIVSLSPTKSVRSTRSQPQPSIRCQAAEVLTRSHSFSVCRDDFTRLRKLRDLSFHRSRASSETSWTLETAIAGAVISRPLHQDTSGGSRPAGQKDGTVKESCEFPVRLLENTSLNPHHTRSLATDLGASHPCIHKFLYKATDDTDSGINITPQPCCGLSGQDQRESKLERQTQQSIKPEPELEPGKGRTINESIQSSLIKQSKKRPAPLKLSTARPSNLPRLIRIASSGASVPTVVSAPPGPPPNRLPSPPPVRPPLKTANTVALPLHFSKELELEGQIASLNARVMSLEVTWQNMQKRNEMLMTTIGSLIRTVQELRGE
jgi:hypothetical protein